MRDIEKRRRVVADDAILMQSNEAEDTFTSGQLGLDHPDIKARSAGPLTPRHKGTVYGDDDTPL